MKPIKAKFLPSKKVETIQMGKRFDEIDGFLPWNQVKYFDPRACRTCFAAANGSCWVKGLSLPKDGKCNIKNKEFDEWRGRERI